MKVYTLTHIADGMGGVTAFGSHLDLWKAIKAVAEEVANDTGRWLPNDPSDWPRFVEVHGWKVQHFDWEEHEISTDHSYLRFRMEPAGRVRCTECRKPIRHDEDDMADEWQDESGRYQCTTGGRDHAPAEVTR